MGIYDGVLVHGTYGGSDSGVGITGTVSLQIEISLRSELYYILNCSTR